MLINDHRQFLYNGGVDTGRIFERGEEIPDGWYDAPNATEWDNKPVQPEMKMAMVWTDADGKEEIEEIEPEESETEKEAQEDPDEPQSLYCKKCDKEYKDPMWFKRHMKNEHNIVIEE